MLRGPGGAAPGQPPHLQGLDSEAAGCVALRGPPTGSGGHSSPQAPVPLDSGTVCPQTSHGIAWAFLEARRKVAGLAMFPGASPTGSASPEGRPQGLGETAWREELGVPGKGLKSPADVTSHYFGSRELLSPKMSLWLYSLPSNFTKDELRNQQ